MYWSVHPTAKVPAPHKTLLQNSKQKFGNHKGNIFKTVKLDL